MSNPLHSPKVEAEGIAMEAVRRAFHSIDDFIYPSVTPAYRRDTRRYLAKTYNRMLDKSGFDGMALPEDVKE
jgi:hypothetical protein